MADAEKRPAFKSGDVVRLKSDDMMMTVEQVDGDAVTAVFWYMGTLRRQTISGAMLFNQTIRSEWDNEMWRLDLQAQQQTRLAELGSSVDASRQAEAAAVVKDARDRKHRWMGFFH